MKATNRIHRNNGTRAAKIQSETARREAVTENPFRDLLYGFQTSIIERLREHPELKEVLFVVNTGPNVVSDLTAMLCRTRTVIGVDLTILDRHCECMELQITIFRNEVLRGPEGCINDLVAGIIEILDGDSCDRFGGRIDQTKPFTGTLHHGCLCFWNGAFTWRAGSHQGN